MADGEIVSRRPFGEIADTADLKSAAQPGIPVQVGEGPPNPQTIPRVWLRVVFKAAMKPRSFEHVTLFNRIDDESRRAYCQGDLDLDDILGDVSELSGRTRRRLRELIRNWWRGEQK